MERRRETKTQTRRHRNTQTGRHTDIQRHIQTNIHTQTHIYRNTPTGRHTYIHSSSVKRKRTLAAETTAHACVVNGLLRMEKETRSKRGWKKTGRRKKMSRMRMRMRRSIEG